MVGVLTALLAMAAGFDNAFSSAGLDDRTIVLRDGSDAEMQSSISVEAATIVENLPGVMHASPEL